MRKKHRRIIFGGLLALYLATAVFHMNKPLPEGISVATPWRPVEEPVFLADRTWVNQSGERHSSQEIFDEAFALIDQAEHFVVLDMFLFNDFAGTSGEPWRPLTDQLTDALLERKRAVPELRIVLITDPFNTLYGGLENPYLTRLGAAGARVIMTDLSRLRDPNPLWSAFWRWCCQWLGNNTGGWLPSPVGSAPVSLRSYLALLNFKANHRKTLVVDQGDSWAGLVTSGNPHNASSRHSNVGLRFSGPAALDLLETEAAVAAFSGEAIPVPGSAGKTTDQLPRIRIITESAIRDAVIETLEGAQAGEEIQMLMFYLSHRGIIEAMLEAHRRGVDIRVILDPNKDAFGRRKNGIPNRQVALELHRAGIAVRWCDTHGEQCHSKQLLHLGAGGTARLILGSANFTRRNLDDYNLETDVELVTRRNAPVIRDAVRDFDRLWQNTPEQHFTVPYEHYADPSLRRRLLYRIMEATGLSTF